MSIFSILLSTWNYAQPTSDTSIFKPNAGGLLPKIPEQGLSNISISGYYRFLGSYTTMQEAYPEFQNIKNKVFIGDDSNLPQLSMTIGLKPTPNTSISTDLYLWTPLTGSNTDYVKGLLLGVNLYGSHSNKYGTFNVRTGGIHWHKLSPLTFASNTGYNRFSVFERNPWDPNTKNVFDRYNTFYQNGALTQDVRWGQQAFHGFIFDGNDLPYGFNFSFMSGKSQLNGGNSITPNSLTGGRIKKEFNNHFISVNGVHNRTFSDSLAKELVGFSLFTSEFEFNFDKFRVYGEAGSGNYFSPTYESSWGEAVDIRVETNKNLLKIPIELRYFRFSPSVINNNGIFWNTSIQEYVQTAEQNGGQIPLLFPFASALTNIGQMTNNRQGIILNTDMEFRNSKLTIGYSVAKEISALSNRLTYGHPSNSLALSRFWRWNFPTNVGPYGNLNKIFRNVYESVTITDSVTAKGFNSLEISFKTQTRVFNKRLMLFYLGGFHSLQNTFSPVPVYNKTAYLQSYNHQFDLYYELNRNIALCGYLGLDRIIAGNNTERNPVNNSSKNQKGISYALGLDLMLSKNTGLYIRNRWMTYKDYSFALDRYKGIETTIELKIFF